MSGIHSTHDSFAFIQARLGSTRFPKKILKPIPEDSGITFLDHIHRRLSSVFEFHQIVFLIPETDEESIQFLKSRGYLYFCGSELDVRDRFREAAKQYGAKHIFRLTADNPFIDIDAVRYLYEAILEIKDTYYSLSMVGLPLGMGVECFSSASLFYQTDETDLERHKEHVSLHIKEFPEIHKQYRLSPPHLTQLDDSHQNHRESLSKLRITVDEPKDYELICEIWKTLGETNPNFGATEIFQLKQIKPELFQINANVEQVIFSLPHEEKTQKQIHILYGNPKEYGYGHLERCRSLNIFLQIQGYDVRMNDHFREEDKNIPHILDIREIEFPITNAFYIDNLNHPPNKMNACFFLPHPTHSTLNHTHLSYYSSPLSELNRDIEEIPGKILVYAGQLDEIQSEQIDHYLLQFYKTNVNSNRPIFQTIFRIGGTKPKSPMIEFHPRISYIEFLREIESSEWICTYFGQTMMEAAAKRKKVCLLGISEIHSSLGMFAEKELAIPYIGSLQELSMITIFPETPIQNRITYRRDAHTKILNWLQTVT